MTISYRPKLRSLLLVVNCLVLLLPISGLFFFKMYESQLIRQTEASLIGQAAFLSSIYVQELTQQAGGKKSLIKFEQALPPDSPFKNSTSFTPINPSLDMATEQILPPSPNGIPPALPADHLSRTVGQSLIPLLKNSQKITLSGIRIVDYNGVVVSSSGSELGLSLEHRQEIRKALQGNYISVLRKRVSDEPRPSYSSPSRKGWIRVLVAMPIIYEQQIVGAVLLSRSPIGIGKGLYFVRKHLLFGSIIVISLVVAITWLTNAVISKPIHQLVKKTKKVKDKGGELEPLTHGGTREVAELSESISEMATTLQKRAEYIQNFARHVSHEFKTPITAIQGSIELMQDLEHEMSEKDKKRFLKNMDQDVRHLDQLTKGLLELARADMVLPGMSTCNPSEIVQEIIDYKNNDNQKVLMLVHGEQSSIKMDSEIFRGIILNLVENSFLHGKATQVSIELSFVVQHNISGTQITVTDNGNGISLPNQEKIFTPFFTTARNEGGTGLGLSINKAILENHAGQIALSPTYIEGCRFSLFIP